MFRNEAVLYDQADQLDKLKPFAILHYELFKMCVLWFCNYFLFICQTLVSAVEEKCHAGCRMMNISYFDHFFIFFTI